MTRAALALLALLLLAPVAWGQSPTPTETPGTGCCACFDGDGNLCGTLCNTVAEAFCTTSGNCTGCATAVYHAGQSCFDPDWCGGAIQTWTPTSTPTETPTRRQCIVNSTSDADCATPTPGPLTPIPDIPCDDGAGNCTLRCAFTKQAIPDGGPAHCRDNTISFSIPGDGAHTIVLGSSLPNYDGDLIIDGTTQPGTDCGNLWAPTPTPPVLNVVIDGTGSTAPFVQNFGTITVQGLKFINFPAVGLNVLGEIGGTSATIRCNWFDHNNAIAIACSSDNFGGHIYGGPNPGDGNIITNTGTDLTGFPPNTITVAAATVQGNWIGVNPDGTLGPNANEGIRAFANPPASSLITIGGTGSARNLISGNGSAGIFIDSSVSNVVVQDNLVGVAPDGSQNDGYCNCLGTFGGGPACDGQVGRPPPGSQIFDANSATLTGNTVGDCFTPTPTATDTPPPAGPTDTPTPTPHGCFVLAGAACAPLGGAFTCADYAITGGPITQFACDFFNGLAPGCCLGVVADAPGCSVPGDPMSSCAAPVTPGGATATPSASPTPTATPNPCWSPNPLGQPCDGGQGICCRLIQGTPVCAEEPH